MSWEFIYTLVCAPFAPKSNNQPKHTLACYSILWWCTTGRQARKRLWCKTHCIQRQINAQALPCTKSPNTTASGKELNCGWCRCYCFIKAKHFYRYALLQKNICTSYVAFYRFKPKPSYYIISFAQF